MVEGRRRGRAVPAPRPLAVVVALATSMLAPASRAEWKFTPLMELRETYTDNVTLLPKEQAESQFVTELVPGFTLENHGPRLQFRSSYNKHLFKYSNQDVAGTRGSAQQLQADARAKLIGELLFLDASASISQQAASLFGQQQNSQFGNGFATANSNEVKTYRISPYLQHRFGTQAELDLRYARDRVSSDNSALGTSSSDNLTLNLNSGAAYRLLGWGVFYNRQNVSDNIAQDSGTQALSVSLRYIYSPALTLSVNGGYDKNDYQSQGGVTQGKSWSTGLNWQPGPRTSLQLNVGKRYYGDSYLLAASHRSRATVWSINYSDAVTSTRSQFLLPSTIDTFGTLDRLFSANIPDAAVRRQVVDAYILANGLPPSLANSINYLSNRYMLQKQFQASVALNSARSTLILALVDSRRTALSSQQVDNALLGSSNSNLNDNTRQSAANASLNWRWSARTSVNLVGSYSSTKSESASRSDKNKALRLTMSREFQARLRGSVELRRVRGAAVDGKSYTENAVAASLSKQF